MLVDYVEFIKNSKYIKELGMWLFRGDFFFAYMTSDMQIELR